ncbi:MAG: MBOAT family protein [Clostridia bacterium]|nr:MBOAT family protein [Clostridia bacterium]
MSFASVDFIVFFVFVLIITYILGKFNFVRAKEIFLLAASYFFYAYWDWRFCGLLLFVTVTAYFTAKFVKNKAAFTVGIIVPLLVLGFFKYFNFFTKSFAAIFGGDAILLNIILPVGISFYTFQALSYVVDVKRGKLAVETDFIKLALYLAFFPQLVAGPIVRACDFLPQLEQKRGVTRVNIESGIQLILFGLIKKIVLADHLSVFIDDVYAYPTAFKWSTVVLAVLAYAMQMYFDFSGYSDIAIGCAKCMGYDFKRNFNLPFAAYGVADFWVRWHISLSTWLKDYVYIPLGGNRRGEVRKNINLLITMMVGGLWHGAGYTYLFWGLLNGSFLCIDKYVNKKPSDNFFIRLLQMAWSYVFFAFSLIFIRSENFTQAWQIITAMFTFQQGISQPFVWVFVSAVPVILCTAYAIRRSKKEGLARPQGYYPQLDLHTVGGLTAMFIAMGIIFLLSYTGEKPFIYFQF